MKLIKDLGIVNGRRKGIYECSRCKTHIERRTSHVKNSKTSLCKGCLMSDKMKTHGKTNTRLFKIWSGMRDRCYNEKSKNFKDYGAKGVTICDEWKDSFESFYDWSIHNGYNDDLVIDKDIKCDELGLEKKLYSPNTCVWITPLENTLHSNSKTMKEVYQYDLDGAFVAKYRSQQEASRQTGISQGNIGEVLRGSRNKAGGYTWKYILQQTG